MSKMAPFNSLLNNHVNRSALIFCPGKNILQWKEQVVEFIKDENLVVLGSNKVTELIIPDYHIFTNNDKYERYGNCPHKSSTILIGSHILERWVQKHSPEEYVKVSYTDKDKTEPMSYNPKEDIVRGYYRTSGNLAIMLFHLMGISTIYIAGMSGFTYKFDGTVHYYPAEIKRDVKRQKEWYRKYDQPVLKSLDDMKKYGIDFKIITPTIYKAHFDGSILGIENDC